jgi:hypothetical protein
MNNNYPLEGALDDLITLYSINNVMAALIEVIQNSYPHAPEEFVYQLKQAFHVLEP